MSLGADARVERMLASINDPVDWVNVTGTLGEVKARCDKLATCGYKYSRGGYNQLENGDWIRTMYLWENNKGESR